MGNRLFQEPSRGGELALLEVEARQRVERAPQGQTVLGHVGKQAQERFLRIECLVINLLRRQLGSAIPAKGPG